MKAVVKLLGVLIGLSSCGQTNDASQTAANQPATPPDCPDFPELKNVRLKDGSVADVRILTDGDLKFYIPASWFVHVKGAGTWEQRLSHLKGEYDPEILEVECPGVIHRKVSGTVSILTPMVHPSRDVPPNFSSGSKVTSVSFYKMLPRQTIDGYGPIGLDRTVDQVVEHGRPGNPLYRAEAVIVAVPNKLNATFRLPGGVKFGSPQYGALKDDVRELGSWIMTPPNHRENHKVFELGVR